MENYWFYKFQYLSTYGKKEEKKKKEKKQQQKKGISDITNGNTAKSETIDLQLLYQHNIGIAF